MSESDGAPEAGAGSGAEGQGASGRPSEGSGAVLPPLREVIRAHGLSASKAFGQNFILDLNLTRRIARLAPPEGRVIVEIGPGPGGLTRALLDEGARTVIAVEFDQRCRPILDEIQAAYGSQRVVPVFADALKVDWLALVPRPEHGAAMIVANLPYGIATLLLTGWLERDPWPPWWARMVLMFQREVAERIVAEPGTKAYGRLAVLAQWRSRPRIGLHLPPAAFTPPPKVASSVVVFDPIADPFPACRAQDLARVTQAAFGQRRKMLRQSLKPLCRNVEWLLGPLGIDPERRAETLSVEEFARIALAIGPGGTPRSG